MDNFMSLMPLLMSLTGQNGANQTQPPFGNQNMGGNNNMMQMMQMFNMMNSLNKNNNMGYQNPTQNPMQNQFNNSQNQGFNNGFNGFNNNFNNQNYQQSQNTYPNQNYQQNTNTNPNQNYQQNQNHNTNQGFNNPPPMANTYNPTKKPNFNLIKDFAPKEMLDAFTLMSATQCPYGQ